MYEVREGPQTRVGRFFAVCVETELLAHAYEFEIGGCR